MKVWIVMGIYDCYDAEWEFCGAFSTREKAIEQVKQDFHTRFEDYDIDTEHEPNKTFYHFYTEGCVEYEVFETDVD